ncbi:SIR2 family protein [Streptococcus ruminicola]|uniref:SIR2 family protein n=1 Tax=Streptococcus ruminicola TaxID=2686210 RepID=UPI003F6110DB
MNLNDVAKIIQEYLADSPLVVLGSGASVPYGLPTMRGLADVLRKDALLQAEENSAKLFSDMDLIDLEKAIDNNTLSDKAKKRIRTLTWKCINEKDLKLFKDKNLEEKMQPLVKLIKKIITTSPNQLTIVTTNYDRLSEYAVDLYRATTVTGFEGNLFRKFDGFSEHVNSKRIAARERVVKILKVHGSLDWFKTENEDIVSFPLQKQIPSGYTPLIVPPGKEKYSTTHDEPYRSIIEEADKEFKKAGSFLCIGYGFNDSHIQPKLISQIKNAGKPIVVITKEATAECMRLVADSNVKKYLILEDNGSETRVISNKGKAIVSGNVWSLNEFMEVW